MAAYEKKLVTEKERNAVFLILTPDEFHSFENSLCSLIQEYRNNGSLNLTTLIPILGKAPNIPQSPDMDTMLEAYEEMAEYSKKSQAILNFLAYEVPRLEA